MTRGSRSDVSFGGFGEGAGVVAVPVPPVGVVVVVGPVVPGTGAEVVVETVGSARATEAGTRAATAQSAPRLQRWLACTAAEVTSLPARVSTRTFACAFRAAS
jgi:hypothetical protein